MDDKKFENENVTSESDPVEVPTPVPETEAAPEAEPAFVNGDPNAKPPVDTTVMPKVEFTPPPQPEPTNYITIETPKSNNNGIAIASMVCGISGAVFGVLGICGACCCWPITIIVSIVAVVFAIVDRVKKKTFSGFTIAGLICGIIGIVIPIAYVLFTIGLNYEAFMEEFWEAYNEGLNGEFKFDY